MFRGANIAHVPRSVKRLVEGDCTIKHPTQRRMGHVPFIERLVELRARSRICAATTFVPRNRHLNQKTRDDGTLMRDTTGAAAGGGEATTRARSRRCASAPAGTRARTGHRSSTCSPSGSAPRVGPTASNRTCVEIKFLRRVRGHRVIDATPARWRGDASSSPLDRARMAASSPGNDLVKNCRVHPTHWLISTQSRTSWRP